MTERRATDGLTRLMVFGGTSLVVGGAILLVLTNTRAAGVDLLVWAGILVGAGGLSLMLGAIARLVRQR